MAGRTGPGPGAYALPPTVGYEKHDFTRKRNPAYSLGVKPPVDHTKPGPAPYNIREKQTRYGNTYSPAYSFAGRTGLTVRDNVPGPGTYAPENCPPMKEKRNPAFSIGGRTATHKAGIGPGPNQYSVPSTMGKGGFSIAGRPTGHQGFQSPGPANYNPPNVNVYKQKAPHASIIGRTGGVSDKSRTPGPAAYNPESGRKGELSFGVKHSENSPPLILEEDNF